MALEVDQTILLCGLKGKVREDEEGYYIDPSAYFKALNLDRNQVDDFYMKVLGYSADRGYFPYVKTLEDLKKLVDEMNSMYDTIVASKTLLNALVARHAPKLALILKPFLNSAIVSVEEVKGWKHLCETPEECALFKEIVPKDVVLTKDIYISWVKLHPDTKLTAPAFRLLMDEETALSKEEEALWKKELETYGDFALFKSAHV